MRANQTTEELKVYRARLMQTIREDEDNEQAKQALKEIEAELKRRI